MLTGTISSSLSRAGVPSIVFRIEVRAEETTLPLSPSPQGRGKENPLPWRERVGRGGNLNENALAHNSVHKTIVLWGRSQKEPSPIFPQEICHFFWHLL